MSVVDFKASRRAITERLAAAEGAIVCLEAQVESQQRTIELLGEVTLLWLSSGPVFRQIEDVHRRHEQRLGEVERVLQEMRKP